MALVRTETDPLGLGSCSLASGPFAPRDRRCDWCGAGLTGRKLRWCCAEHGQAWATNHSWTNAKGAARKRDGFRCQRCGAIDTNVEAEIVFAFLSMMCPPRRMPSVLEWNQLFPDVDYAERVMLRRLAAQELHRPWNEARTIMEKVRREARLEVHHLIPVLGRHAEAGCWHHLDGLVTVCKPCHKVITAEQRAAGMLDGAVHLGVR